MSGVLRSALTRLSDHRFDDVIAVLTRCTGPGLIVQAGQTVLGMARTPFTDRLLGIAHLIGDYHVLHAIRRKKDDLGSLLQISCQLSPAAEGTQLLTFSIDEIDGSRWAARRHKRLHWKGAVMSALFLRLFTFHHTGGQRAADGLQSCEATVEVR